MDAAYVIFVRVGQKDVSHRRRTDLSQCFIVARRGIPRGCVNDHVALFGDDQESSTHVGRHIDLVGDFDGLDGSRQAGWTNRNQ